MELLPCMIFSGNQIIGSFQKRSKKGGGGETKLFLIIVNVLGHPRGVRGLTSNFLRGGGMDVFWNDPFHLAFAMEV